jgi:MFS family permease
VVMNIVYSATAYPIGVISDRTDRRLLLAAGFVALIAADLVLAFAPGIWFVMLGVVFWGLHMGMTQGLLASLIADATSPQQRGTGFGLFNFASGIAMLIGNLIAGILWDATGPTATFLVGAALTAVALVAIVPLLRRQEGTTR